MDHKKMMTTAKNLDVLAKVGGGIAKAMAMVCLIFVVLVLVFGEKMFVEGSLTLDLDFVKLYMAENFQAVTTTLKIYTIVGLLGAGVLCLVLSYAAGLVREILAPMKEGRPFEKCVAANLKKIGWVVVMGGAVIQILGVVERFLITKAYPMEEVFSYGAIQKVEYAFTLDFTFVLIACVIFFLSYIFSYGQVLQQESDETL